MTIKKRYHAQHENGTEWDLAASPKMAANYARNFCRRERIPGKVTITNVATGESTTVVVNSDYSI